MKIRIQSSIAGDWSRVFIGDDNVVIYDGHGGFEMLRAILQALGVKLETVESDEGL